MKKTKLAISELNVSSFTTSLRRTEQIRGGASAGQCTNNGGGLGDPCFGGNH